MSRRYLHVLPSAASLLVGGLLFLPRLRLPSPGEPPAIEARLSEWKIELSETTITGGPMTLTVSNTGNIPHQLEIEGHGIERRTGLIQPGASAMLRVTLEPGSYEIYCPVGDDSHKKLGMDTHLAVTGQGTSTPKGPAPGIEQNRGGSSLKTARQISVDGGGPVIQILPGPFPFADSLAGVLPAFGDERSALESQARSGPYSNMVARVSGTFSLTAWDRGATGDSVAGVAEFTTADAARWKLVMDRVQTQDVPHHPRFGGVIMGLYYHGVTTVHTPLVPTISSAVALWSVAHLYRNGTLVSDNAQVHAMLLSRTRREGDFALACWDCSRNTVDELQLQVTPAKGEPPLEAPGGFLFVNWEKSAARR
jgi:plastocyanin